MEKLVFSIWPAKRGGNRPEGQIKLEAGLFSGVESLNAGNAVFELPKPLPAHPYSLSFEILRGLAAGSYQWRAKYTGQPGWTCEGTIEVASVHEAKDR